MAGILRIDFNDIPVAGSRVTVRAKYLNSNGDFNTVTMHSNFVNRRMRNTDVSIADSVIAQAQNYASAFNLDYGNTGGADNLEAKIASPGVVEISINNDAWEFVSFDGGSEFSTYTITNEITLTPKKVIFTGYDYEASTCSTPMAIFDIAGGAESYNAYADGEVLISGQPSPIKVPLDRNRSSPYLITFTDSLGTDIGSISLKTPPRITPDKINVSNTYTDQGAVLSVAVEFVSSHVLPLTYSLDGVNYIEDNLFTGQPSGDYTIYVKDAFGCVTEKSITVDGVSTVTETIFEISDINPIRYSKEEEGKKNRYNTLSHEQLKNVAYPFIQHFTDKDSPITQIKTNAKHLNVFAMDCDGGTTTLNPVKRSNHIGQELKTTGTKFSTEDNRLGIYFGVADVLDPLSDDLIETKDYGYQVPYGFNKIGRFVTVEGLGTVPVDSIAYDDSYEAFVLLFNISFAGEETPTTVRATYNIQNYEIYEFVADISNLPDNFNIVIEAGQSATDVKYTYISERIQKTVDSDKLTEIIYWNTTNLGSMNYATGVVHTLRLHNVLSRLADEQTVDGYNGDTERYNTNHEIFDGEEFIFAYLSEEMVRKMRTILAHDMLFINGVHYRLGDVPELTSRFTTNICELTAVLRKGGDQTENFDTEIIEPYTGEGVDQATYELEQAIAAAKGKALILWKK